MGCYEVGTEIIVASLIYIDRLLEKNKHITLTETNAKSILHSALTLASKFYLDKYERKTIFYAVCGLSKK
jgi:Cyclin